MADFAALHVRKRDGEAVAFAFDLMMLDGEDWRGRPWLERWKALKRLLSRTAAGLTSSDHIEGGGRTVFAHACKLGLEGIVSKLIDAPCRSGKCTAWVKVKSPTAPVMLRFRA